MKILLKNAKILSMKNEQIVEGHIAITDNRISDIGPNVSLSDCYDQIIDCQGNLLMPGFKNAHSHSAMTFLRSKADDSSLHDWLFNEIFPREENLYPGCIEQLSKVAILEYLTSGITACLDQYFFLNEFEKTAVKFGFRLVNLVMYNPKTRPIELCLDYLKTNEKKDYLVKYVVGLHSEYTGNDDLFNGTKKLLETSESKFYVHLSETSSEVQDCLIRRGVTPLQFFDSMHFFDRGGAIFHGVYLNDEDFKIIKKRNITVVSNPSSNMKLASGIAEIKKMLDMGINIALGTDGPASNNALDMFREMYLVTGLQKLLLKNPVSIPSFEVLKMATVNGAKAMGLDDADVLDVGKLADIIMIDLRRPCMQPINNILNNIVYAGSKDAIKMTMINGKILYYDYKFLIDEDIDDIYKKVQDLTDELSIIKKQI